jgi:hypothetical protein
MRSLIGLFHQLFHIHKHHRKSTSKWSFYYYFFGNEEEHPHSHQNPHYRMTEREIMEMNDQKDENGRLEREYQNTYHGKRKYINIHRR